MTLLIACSKCEEKSTVLEDLIGSQFICPKCGHAWLVAEHGVDPDVESKSIVPTFPRTMLSMILDSLIYPLQINGIGMILIGAVFWVILAFLEFSNPLAICGIVLQTGYFGSYFLEVVGRTMNKEKEIPDWPSITDFWEDIFRPSRRILGLILFSWALGITAAAIAISVAGKKPEEPSSQAMIFAVFATVFCLYFPMSVLASEALGRFLAVSPHIVIPAVFRTLPEYLAVVGGFSVMFILGQIVLNLVGINPYAGSTLKWMIAYYGYAAFVLYAIIFQGRLIGLIYVKKMEKLGWS